MSFIRMKKDDVLALCDAAIRRIAEMYENRRIKELKKHLKEKNYWRKFWSLGFKRPLTEEEMHDYIYQFISFEYLHYYNLCHPESDSDTLLAESLKTACKHAETICMSVEDLATLENYVSAKRRSGPQETGGE